jgi:glycosyltransferase involved in cell wall biosynthesis
MKILHVIPSYLPAYQIGGPVKFTHDLCKALVSHGVEVSVFTTTAGLDRIPRPLPCKNNIDGVDLTYFPSSFFKKYNHAYGIARAIRKRVRDYDLVHIHSVFSYTTLVASSACRKNNIPYILNPLGALDADMINLKNTLAKKAYLEMIEKNNIEGASVIHLASDYERRKFQALGFGQKIEIIPPGLDLSEYNKQGDILRIRYPKLKEKKIVLYLGRIHPKKGLEILLKAFAKVIMARDDTYLVVAGPIDGYAKKIISFVKKESVLNKRVIFTDMLLGTDKVAAFYASDVFVLSSYGENFGVAALEALACGVPVVLTKEVGLSPDVEEYGAGFIVKQDALEISEAIEKLLCNHDLREAISLHARSLAQERFNLDIIVNKVIGLYESIIKKKL